MRNSAPRRMIPIVALTLTLALCVQAPYVALADDTGSSSAGSADAVAQSDSSSSVIAQSDSSSSVVAQSDSSSSVVAQTDDSSSSSAQAAEVSAPVAEQAPVSAQAAEEDGWHSDAGGTYYVRGGSRVVSAWLVLEVAPSGEKVGWQRYWVGADGYLAKGRLVTETESGRWAYAESDGSIARGRYVDSATGYVYLADNDGRLESPGWHVTSAYGSGLQRYWVDSATHACVPGYSTDGWAHWTTDWGYVLRGSLRYDSDGILVADNDGKLAECYSSGGWLVTSAFTGSLERYRIDDCCGGILGAHVGSFSIDGNLYYGNPSTGYEYRNDYVSIGSTTYYADNDGVLTPAIQYHNVAWAGQPNNFFCGPTSGYMILRNVGAWTSARGDSLTIENVASYMDTRSYGYTSLQDRKFEQGMNDWLGDSIYTTIHTPSYAQVRSAVLSSYQTGYATAVDAMERRGGPHYNGHNNGTFAHIMVVDGYNSRTDAVYLVDPGAGVLWSSGSQHFWYPSLETFTETYLQTEYYNDGREHIGIYYAVK